MPHFIDEYLVRLGASVDQSGMANFYRAIRDASGAVNTSAGNMTTAMLKAQVEIVSGFAAIGGAAVGMADKVAQADQSYRLFAMHMYISKNAARGLKVAMDALGEPLENLTWDAELRERTRQLLADQRTMAAGGDFDAQMRKIRDMRFEITRAEVELKYLGMHVVQDFMKALGLGPATLEERLKKFNDWVAHNLPAISQKIVTNFLPVWHMVVDTLRDVGKMAGDAALIFTNLIGILSNDVTLQGSTLNFESMAKALGTVVGWLHSFIKSIAQAESLVLHLLLAVEQATQHNVKGAKRELKAALSELTVGSGAVGGALIGGAAAGLAGAAAGSEGGPVGMVLGGALATPFGMLLGGASGAGYGWARSKFLPSDVEKENSKISKYVDIAAKNVAARGGSISYDQIAQLMRGVLAVESSGGKQFDAQGNVFLGRPTKEGWQAIGAAQLSPDTAKRYGVNPYDTYSNIEGGSANLANLLDKYKTVGSALAAYNWGEGRLDKFNADQTGKATLPREVQDYVVKASRASGLHGDVHVGRIVINVDHPNATAAEIAREVPAAIQAAQSKQTQRNQLEFRSLGYGYGW